MVRDAVASYPVSPAFSLFHGNLQGILAQSGFQKGSGGSGAPQESAIPALEFPTRITGNFSGLSGNFHRKYGVCENL